MRKYKNKLPPLEEDERIYFEIPYMMNGFARATHCGYDPDKKLWFTGPYNGNIIALINKFGINEKTSDKAIKLLDERLKPK